MKLSERFSHNDILTVPKDETPVLFVYTFLYTCGVDIHLFFIAFLLAKSQKYRPLNVGRSHLHISYDQCFPPAKTNSGNIAAGEFNFNG